MIRLFAEERDRLPVDALTLMLFVLGIVLLIVGAELLVNGASALATSFGISPILIGLTVVAFGTSSPELAVAVGSSFTGEPDLVIGTVVGSNIYNVLLILGLAALVAPLVVGVQLVQRDVPLMVLASIGVGLMAADGVIGRLDGLILVGALVGWLGYSIGESRRAVRARRREVDPADVVIVSQPRSQTRNVGFIAGGLVLLVIGARWLVDGAVAVAAAADLPPLIIGLTVVAIGTSLPELATSVVASVRGERDIAVGNVVGSNLFNLLGVLGLTAVIASGGVPVAPAAMAFDLPVMIGVAVACMPVFFTGHAIARWEGALFLGYAVVYTVLVLLGAIGDPAMPAFTQALVFVVVPLTALTLLIFAVRQFREHGLQPPHPHHHERS